VRPTVGEAHFSFLSQRHKVIETLALPLFSVFYFPELIEIDLF
jgi:hypothetical protein